MIEEDVPLLERRKRVPTRKVRVPSIGAQESAATARVEQEARKRQRELSEDDAARGAIGGGHGARLNGACLSLAQCIVQVPALCRRPARSWRARSGCSNIGRFRPRHCLGKLVVALCFGALLFFASVDLIRLLVVQAEARRPVGRGD